MESESVVAPLIDVLIDRATWIRGQGSTVSALLTPEGLKCCLGFAANACGFKDADLKGMLTPADLSYNLDDHPNWMLLLEDSGSHDDGEGIRVPDSKACNELMDTNDTLDLSEAEREERLALQMPKVGFRPIFVGEGMPKAKVDNSNLELADRYDGNDDDEEDSDETLN